MPADKRIPFPAQDFQGPEPEVQVRARLDGRFWAPDAVFDCEGALTLIEKIVDLCLRRHANRNGSTIPLTQGRMARECGVSRRTFNKAIQGLRGKGLVSTSEPKGGPLIYDLHDLEGKLAPHRLRGGVRDMHRGCAPGAQGGENQVHTRGRGEGEDKKGITSPTEMSCHKQERNNHEGIPPSTPEKLGATTPAAPNPGSNGNGVKATILAICQAAGQDPKLVNWGKEGVSIKKALAAGYTPEDIISCYTERAKESYWRGKWVPLAFVVQDLALFL